MSVASHKPPAPEPDTLEAAGGGRRLRGRIDDYRRLEVLGQGTFGVVQKARDRITGKTVAIKSFPSGSDLCGIIREVGFQVACRGDPSIVEIMDVVQDAKTGKKFLVMEFVGSASLRKHITCGCGRSEEVTRVMMRQLIGAAKKMHDAGVIHCDIKPENILVGPLGELKICDFGLAMPVKPPGKTYEKMRPGTVVYSSPELLMESRYYGTAVDMWALGCVMAELLTGNMLFTQDMLFELRVLRYRIAEHGTSAFTYLVPELSEAGREVLVGLLAFDPDERLTAAAALEHRWFSEKAESAAKRPGFFGCLRFPLIS